MEDVRIMAVNFEVDMVGKDRWYLKQMFTIILSFQAIIEECNCYKLHKTFHPILLSQD
jgi:hypothetical protein